MKLFSFLLTAALLSTINIYAQLPDTIWSRSYGGDYFDIPNSIIQTFDSGFVVVGSTASNNGDVHGKRGDLYKTDFWIVKLNIHGDTLWTRTRGGSANDKATCVLELLDNDLIVIGNTESSDLDVSDNYGDSDAWVLKLDRNGDTIWTRHYGGSNDDFVNSVIRTLDGSFLLIGESRSSNYDLPENMGNTDMWIFKIDNSGSLIWSVNYGGSGLESGTTIIQTADSGYLAVGMASSSDGDVTNYHGGGNDGWVVKLDKNGQLEWNNTYGDSDWEEFWDVIKPDNGGYIITGHTKVGSVYDGMIVRIDSIGNLDWSKTYGFGSHDVLYKLIQTDDSSYVACGWSNSVEIASYGSHDIWLLNIDFSGNQIFSAGIGGSNYDESRAMTSTNSGGFVVAGNSASSDGYFYKNNGLGDFCIINFENNQCKTPYDLHLQSLYDTHAELVWSCFNPNNEWQALIGVKGFDTTTHYPITTNDKYIHWVGLEPNTEYDWYVRSVCGEGEYSEWAGPATFRTDCEQEFSAPFYEDFETTEIGDIPDCWRLYNSNPQSFSIGVVGTSDKALEFDIGNPYGPLMLISPKLNDLTTNKRQLRIEASFAPGGWMDWWGNPTLSVGTMTNAYDINSYTEFKEIGITEVSSEYSIVFGSDYQLSDKYIAIKSGRELSGKFGIEPASQTWIDNIAYEEVHATLLEPATLPFVENFETNNGERKNTGMMFYEADRQWDFYVDESHLCQVVWGNGTLLRSFKEFESLPAADVTLRINLEDFRYAEDIELSFNYLFQTNDRSGMDEAFFSDKIYICDDKAEHWVLLYELNLDSLTQNTWHFISGLDIDSALSTATPAQKVSSSFKLRFNSSYAFLAAQSKYELITISGTQTDPFGFFEIGEQSIGTSGHTDVALGDMDGDGDLDAVVTKDGQGDPNKVWLNDGEGIFTDSGLNFGQSESWAVALGDLDGDGDLDGFVANDGSNKVYLNDGANTTDNGQNLGNSTSRDVCLADLDSDGDLDAAVANNENGQPNKVWLNNGDGTFVVFNMDLGNAMSWGLDLGDLDGDGDMDGFVANDGPNMVYLNAGPNTSDNGQSLGTSSGKGIRLGDMDGDGDLDAVVANDATGQPNKVWLNNGNGVFTNSGLSFGDNLSMGLVLGDLDNDGDLDGFVANNGANMVYLNNGANTADNGQYLGNSNSYGAALGDLDNDGDLDAFVANYDGPCKVWINQTLSPEDGNKKLELPWQMKEVRQNNLQLRNYPDPFTRQTTIEFSVPESGFCRLSVYNPYGKLIDVIFESVAEKDVPNKVLFQGNFLPAGMYFVRLQAGGKSVVEKMVLMK